MAQNFVKPIFCVPKSYGLLKIMVEVKMNSAISVLHPAEAKFFHRALNKG